MHRTSRDAVTVHSGACVSLRVLALGARGRGVVAERAIAAGEGRAAVVLGYTSLLNHSDRPNCDFVRHIDALALDLLAVRDIAPGEELTIDYGLTLWFTPE